MQRLSHVGLQLSVFIGGRLDRPQKASLHITSEAFYHVRNGPQWIPAVRISGAKNSALVVLAAKILGRYPVKDEAVKVVEEENLLTRRENVKVVQDGGQDVLMNFCNGGRLIYMITWLASGNVSSHLLSKSVICM